MKIVIDISGWEASRQKEIINSIKGFVKSLSKRIGFRAEFDVAESGSVEVVCGKMERGK